MQTLARYVVGSPPHKALVLIADGRRAILAQNEGAALMPRLEVPAVLAVAENPRNEQAADRPGPLS